MTTRLKLLSALLCVSIVYAVYDYIDRNSVENTARVKKKKKRRARTAGVSASSAKVRKMYNRNTNTKKNTTKDTGEQGYCLNREFYYYIRRL